MYTRYFPSYYSGYDRCYRQCNYVPFRNYYGYGYNYMPYNNFINSNLAYTNQNLYNSGIMNDVIQQSIISQAHREDISVEEVSVSVEEPESYTVNYVSEGILTIDGQGA